MKIFFDLTGEVTLVTGGSRGIGEMTATGFVSNGVKTYISSRKADVCAETAARLSEFGECILIPADLSSMEGVEYLASRHISVNTILPRPVEGKLMAHFCKTTGDEIVEMAPRKRIGEPVDMAGAATYLSSRAGSYVSGVVLPVDAGITGTL